MGYCTVVNYLPFTFIEKKPGQVPDEYIIPPATNEEKTPGLLPVKDTHSNLYMPLQENTFRVPIAADTIANDLVEGLLSAQMKRDIDIAEPAIFFVEGNHTLESLKANYSEVITKAHYKQAVWLGRLVKQADDDWQRFRQHKFITDMERFAARKLGFKREWVDVSAATPLEFENCKFCTTQVLKGAVICPNCKHVLDPIAYAKL